MLKGVIVSRNIEEDEDKVSISVVLLIFPVTMFILFNIEVEDILFES